jgi:MoaA/NifB/PqqE/SkfB family radical SAM enzyme
MKAFLKKSVEDGCKKVLITGGEPLLYKKLEEIVAYAVQLGFEEVSMQTNGIHLTKKKARSLKEAGLDQLVFSIHSHIPLMVDRLMKGKGVLEKQLHGLVNAHEVGLNTPVTIVIVRQNHRIIPEYFEFMVKKFPFVGHYTLNFVDPVGQARGKPGIVPRISEVEPFLSRSLTFLESAGKTFRVERVPLCYMLEFSEYCTELRRIVTKEPNVVRRHEERVSHDGEYFKKEYVRGEACSSCWLNKVCAGVKNGYAEIYGTDEVYPIFVKPEVIVNRAGGD